jgi:hypothetical protein
MSWQLGPAPYVSGPAPYVPATLPPFPPSPGYGAYLSYTRLPVTQPNLRARTMKKMVVPMSPMSPPMSMPQEEGAPNVAPDVAANGYEFDEDEDADERYELDKNHDKNPDYDKNHDYSLIDVPLVAASRPINKANTTKKTKQCVKKNMKAKEYTWSKATRIVIIIDD